MKKTSSKYKALIQEFSLFKTRGINMQQRVHMHDQVFNKVDDIMKHYKKKPVENLVLLFKHFIKHSLVI